jgi:hypothetical protein
MATKVVNIPGAPAQTHPPPHISPISSAPTTTTAFPMAIQIFVAATSADALNTSKMQGSTEMGIHYSPTPTVTKNGAWTTVSYAVSIPSAVLKAELLEASPSQTCARLKIRL